MNRSLFRLAIVFTALMFQPNSLWACAACYGQSDSPLARGMNWGILSLLGVVVFVLGSVASFFVYLGKKSAQAEDAAATGALPEPEREV
jgi:hypothetical protein